MAKTRRSWSEARDRRIGPWRGGRRPQSHPVSWGHLELTLGLVWDRQGSFTLYGYAKDLEGSSALLGQKTLTVDNSWDRRCESDSGGGSAATRVVRIGYPGSAPPGDRHTGSWEVVWQR